jgi:hypothetical protein
MEEERFDSAYYLDLQERLRSLLAEISQQLSAAEANQVVDYIDHNECGLALELLIYFLGDQDLRPITRSVFDSITGLIATMHLDEHYVEVVRPLVQD